MVDHEPACRPAGLWLTHRELNGHTLSQGGQNRPGVGRENRHPATQYCVMIEMCLDRHVSKRRIYAMATPQYTPRQGQFLAFIYYYTKLNGQPPAESDMDRYFRITAPAVHQMVLTLAKNGFIERTPG